MGEFQWRVCSPKLESPSANQVFLPGASSYNYASASHPWRAAPAVWPRFLGCWPGERRCRSSSRATIRVAHPTVDTGRVGMRPVDPADRRLRMAYTRLPIRMRSTCPQYASTPPPPINRQPRGLSAGHAGNAQGRRDTLRGDTPDQAKSRRGSRQRVADGAGRGPCPIRPLARGAGDLPHLTTDHRRVSLPIPVIAKFRDRPLRPIAGPAVSRVVPTRSPVLTPGPTKPPLSTSWTSPCRSCPAHQTQPGRCRCGGVLRRGRGISGHGGAEGLPH